ncbi:MAG: hypothetical protein AUJ31_01475 [Parcubacteria group bacterium CG1_02_39_15]|uniref:Glycerol-3-phosphate acyltransferase n=2 Tax=Candidatus Nealsoniibacteriota TaxID=1817911 RepID=A0A2H0MPT1_9BACT|nr:MAG: hypothetical protein AUJ31_01475 [Parcubacteria group bacterium CG1_02_39_15]PIQ98659.1 MAG: glycerol-3-phosphate acyltransferase [Candidatus Nealsonbacteria bacterium CG11_big_fil_rev_8_21_14_0_20_39_9]PIZ88234.1 MAG: glycerol-3-phosphate acyltransferase [Candidatus Nealsonbacteria bacterium CG_4_10_14_0_2_um_filter_39_15]
MVNFYLILIFIAAYLLGSFPTGYLVVKKFTGQDIRKIGTGNVGAMNVSRATGKGSLFWLTVAADVGKGALAVLLPQWLDFLGYDLFLGITVAGFGAVLGHCYPVFLKFQGGKAQASLIGILGILSWQCLLFPWGGIVIIYILATGYLFLGQFMGAIFLPVVAYFLAPEYFWLSLLMVVPILVRQWPRFIPMLKGQEPKWYWKISKEKKSD